MKKIKHLALMVCLFVCSANSCDPDGDGHWDGRLTIANNTNDTILSFLQFNFPDTLILDQDAPELNAIMVPPKSSGKHYSSIKWEDRISMLNSHNTIMVFIISYDTILRYPWSQIQMDYYILHRYDLTVYDLENLNWTIVYPH
ncbi:MAG: hypothetical protein ACK4VN_15710 [Bacteroidales bacterium]